MPHAFLHSLNIGTLATWLSVAGFGSVGVIVKPWHPESAPIRMEETRLLDEDFTLGAPGDPTAGDLAAEPSPAADAAESPVETLAEPPELPPLAEATPLPEIPELPVPVPHTTPKAMAPAANTRSETRPRSSMATGTKSSSGKAVAPRQAGGPGSGSGPASGMSATSRLAAGRMPSPSYPAEARRKGQTGTVIVEFTVDATGRVISAHAASPSSWPLLNNEAVRTVRRWKFPPGGIMKLQRPIVFQLR